MRRARKPALFRTALATALAAITIPFLAHAALGDEATLSAPSAQVFPTRTGIGVTWDATGATAYRVERKQSADWQDVSGPLTASTTTWVDETIAAGAAADYRVVATTDAESATSPELHATRAAEAPAVGSIDVLALDAHRGSGTTWLRNEIAGPVTASAPVDGSRTLTAGSLKVRMPAFVAGPGYYDLRSPTAVTLTQGDRSCDAPATLRVTAVTYTADLRLETFAGSLAAYNCSDAVAIAWYEIRYRSALDYQALSVEPETADAGRVRYGNTANIPVTLKNVGSAPIDLGGTSWRLGPSNEWTIPSDDCPDSLPVAATCAVTITFRPVKTGPASNTLTFYDSTASQRHSVTVSGTGVDVAAAQNVAVRATYNGHTVSWRSQQTAGSTAVRGYNLYKYLNGVETVEWYPAKASTDDFVVVQRSTTPGIEYAVSLVNEVGEGPVSDRLRVPLGTEQIAITQGQTPETRDLAGADLYGHLVPFPAEPESVTPKEAVATAPNGAALAYVTTDTEQILWTRLVAPGKLGVPMKLWTSTSRISHLAWSPDGSRIAFQSPENGTPCVYVVAAAGGAPVKVACDMNSPSWTADAHRLAVVDRRLAPARLAIIEAKAGGARVTTLPYDVADVTEDTPVRVSPDGSLIALGSGTNLRLVGAVGLNGSVTGSDKKSAALDAPVRAITWEPAGQWLLALTTSGRLQRLVLSVTGDPSLSGGLAGGTNAADIAWQRLGITIAPTAAVLGPDISIPVDTSALPAGTRLSCRLLQGATQRSIDNCTSPVTTTGLHSGTYQLIVGATAPDGSGSVAYRTFTVDATGPVARVTGPNYQSSVAGTAKITVAAADTSGVASYDVRYKRASFAGPYSAYVQPWTNTTATSMNLSVAAGYEYCVSVRAKDKFGNVGGWSADRCFSRPLDDRSMSLATTGWARGSSTKFYYGTDTQTTASGKALTRTVQGKRFFLVATRCPSCGAVAVYAGSKYLTTVNLAYPTTHYQVVLGLPVQSTLFSGTLTLRTVTSGKMIQIDGLAVGRT